MVGVLGLPTPIVKAGYRSAMATVEELATSAAGTESGRVAQRLLDLVAGSGPPGWIDWLIHFRNTLVHRARSMSMNEMQPTAKLYGPNGELLLRVRPVELLATNPHWTDVEAFAAVRTGGGKGASLTLTEPAELTLAESVKSTVGLACSIVTEVLNHWRWRRANPAASPQPPSQWLRTETSKATGFAGFAHGRIDFNPSFMVANPELADRMAAAHLLDHQQ